MFNQIYLKQKGTEDMKKKILLVIFLLGVFFTAAISNETLYQKNDCKTQLEQLNNEIQYLEELKLGLEGRAVRYENQAQRLQFEKDQQIEAKRLWNMAAQNRQAAEELDKKIKEKKLQKEKFIKENNCIDEAKLQDNQN